MTKRKKSKVQTKVIYRNKTPAEPSFEKLKGKLKTEISELEAKKSTVPKGFKGLIQRGAINKAISDRRKILKSERDSEFTKRKTIQLKSQIEFQKSKNELQELRQKNQVNFGDFGFTQPKKDLKFEDLY